MRPGVCMVQINKLLMRPVGGMVQINKSLIRPGDCILLMI
jgi:hypothetical protein